MKKKCAWWAVPVLLISGLITGQHEKDAYSAGDIYGKPSSASVTSINTPQAKGNGGQSKWHSVSWELAYDVLGWPAGITVWALLITFIAIAVQARETVRAARATERAAKAALMNAKALVNSERPWLIAEPVESTRMPGFYEIRIKNVGRTPARFLYGDATQTSAQYPNQLPVPPIYSFPIVVPAQILIAPNRSFKTGGYNVPHLRQGHELSANTLILFGRVVYEDEIIPGIQHETRWCFGYLPVPHGLMSDLKFVRSGPNEYTKHS